MKAVIPDFGDLFSALYAEFLEVYGDEDLASIATANALNKLLAEALGKLAASQDQKKKEAETDA